MELINLKNITYKRDERNILGSLNLVVNKGEKILLQGKNGSGKSTLLNILTGLLYPESGNVVIFDKERKEEKDFVEVRKRAGMLFQDSDCQLFCTTVFEDVAFGPVNLGKKRDEVKNIVKHSLKNVGLEGFENRITYHMSGGEKRLAAIAGVLAMNPDVLLLDEPEAGLDFEKKERLLKILSIMDKTMIIVSHDNIEHICTHKITLNNGKITKEKL